MPLIVVCSTKGRPGVTTTALGLAATLPATACPVVVECDPAGGDLAARHHLRATVGLMELATATRPGAVSTPEFPVDPRALPARPAPGRSAQGGNAIGISDLLSRHAQRIHLRDRLFDLVVAPPGGIQARAAITVLADPTNTTLCPPERVVVADCGRLDSWSPAWPLLGKADVVLVLVRGRGEDLAHLGEHMTALSGAAGPRLNVVVTGERALYGPADVAGLVDAGGDPVPVLAGLPADQHSAAVLAGDVAAGRRWRRLPLMTALDRIAADPRLRLTTTGRDVEPSEVAS